MVMKRREEGEKQNSPRGRSSVEENIGRKACLPSGCASIFSKERVMIWQEPSVSQARFSGRNKTCNNARSQCHLVSDLESVGLLAP